jgi:hypothetical protein
MCVVSSTCVVGGRPLTRRADAGGLVDAIRLAKDAECSTALIQSAERCLNSALAEVKLLGAVTVCKVDGCVARCV